MCVVIETPLSVQSLGLLEECQAHLFEAVSVLLAGGLHGELGTEDVTEFSSVAVPPT